MPLPRNLLSHNQKAHSKLDKNLKINKIFTDICDKNNVHVLTFRECMLINDTIENISYNEIRGNMRAGILIIDLIDITTETGVYDLLELEKKKITNAENTINDQQKVDSDHKGNKFYRRFLSDIQKSFNLKDEKIYKYFEIKIETTSLIIETPKTYRLTIENKNYLFVAGDLKMKSKLMREKDPTYKLDQTIKDNENFLEKVNIKS